MPTLTLPPERPPAIERPFVGIEDAELAQGGEGLALWENWKSAWEHWLSRGSWQNGAISEDVYDYSPVPPAKVLRRRVKFRYIGPAKPLHYPLDGNFE
jgi:hypothetical protein